MQKEEKIVKNTKLVDLTLMEGILGMETALHSMSLELAVAMREKVQAQVNRVGYGETDTEEEIILKLCDNVEQEEITISLQIGDFFTKYIYPYQFDPDDRISSFQEESEDFFQE